MNILTATLSDFILFYYIVAQINEALRQLPESERMNPAIRYRIMCKIIRPYGFRTRFACKGFFHFSVDIIPTAQPKAKWHNVGTRSRRTRRTHFSYLQVRKEGFIPEVEENPFLKHRVLLQKREHTIVHSDLEEELGAKQQSSESTHTAQQELFDPEYTYQGVAWSKIIAQIMALYRFGGSAPADPVPHFVQAVAQVLAMHPIPAQEKQSFLSYLQKILKEDQEIEQWRKSLAERRHEEWEVEETRWMPIGNKLRRIFRHVNLTPEDRANRELG